MKFTYTLKLSDYTAYYSYLYLDKQTHRGRLSGIGKWVLLLSIIISVYALTKANYTSAAVTLITGVILFILYPTIQYKSYVFSVKKMFKGVVKERGTGKITFETTNNGIATYAPWGDTKNLFSDFDPVIITDNYYFLILKESGDVLVLPTKAVSNKNSFEEIIKSLIIK